MTILCKQVELNRGVVTILMRFMQSSFLHSPSCHSYETWYAGQCSHKLHVTSAFRCQLYCEDFFYTLKRFFFIPLSCVVYDRMPTKRWFTCKFCPADFLFVISQHKQRLLHHPSEIYSLEVGRILLNVKGSLTRLWYRLQICCMLQLIQEWVMLSSEYFSHWWIVQRFLLKLSSLSLEQLGSHLQSLNLK